MPTPLTLALMVFYALLVLRSCWKLIGLLSQRSEYPERLFTQNLLSICTMPLMIAGLALLQFLRADYLGLGFIAAGFICLLVVVYLQRTAKKADEQEK